MSKNLVGALISLLNILSCKVLDAEFKNWLAFATQKLDEVTQITQALRGEKNEEAFRKKIQFKQSLQRSSMDFIADSV